MSAGKRYAYERGTFALSFPGTALPADGDTGDEFAIPPYVHGEMPYTFAWQTTVLNGGTFSAINVTLEGSLDGVNWYTMDTSTNVAGEIRTISGKKARFLRIKKVSSTTATGTPFLQAGFAA